MTREPAVVYIDERTADPRRLVAAHTEARKARIKAAQRRFRWEDKQSGHTVYRAGRGISYRLNWMMLLERGLLVLAAVLLYFTFLAS